MNKNIVLVCLDARQKMFRAFESKKHDLRRDHTKNKQKCMFNKIAETGSRIGLKWLEDMQEATGNGGRTIIYVVGFCGWCVFSLIWIDVASFRADYGNKFVRLCVNIC